MRTVLVMMLMLCSVATAMGDVVGPLIQEDADFPGFAVFQVNSARVRRGDKVVVKRQGKPVSEGLVKEIADSRCLVKFKESHPLFRGDVLHKLGKSKKPSLTTAFSTQQGIQRTRLSKQLRKKKTKRGRSPHVLTPAEMAAQSRRSSVYTLGGVGSAKTIAERSRSNSKWTMGKSLTVKQMAEQMKW